MVVWSEYYSFQAESVEAIETAKGPSNTHPFILNVYLKSGKMLSVSYSNVKVRKAAMLDLGRQIDSEKRRDTEKIHNLLYHLQGSINRIDKRQLRIWRQLKELLGVEVEDKLDGE